MSGRRFAPAVLLAACLLAAPAPAQTPVEMQTGFPNARFVPRYSPAERAAAAAKLLKLSAAPALGQAISLTPNAPFAADGSHLSFWKPSFVIGTPDGGEAGVDFWGIHVGGHINVAFPASAAMLLDCRLLSSGRIAYKIYAGPGDAPVRQGDAPLDNNHLLLEIPAAAGPVSVELWPDPENNVVGFFGCDLAPIG